MMLVWLLPVNCARLWFGKPTASGAMQAMVNFILMASLRADAIEPLRKSRCLPVFEFKLAIRHFRCNADQFPVEQIFGRFDQIARPVFRRELQARAAIGLMSY